MVYPLYDLSPTDRAQVVWLISDPATEAALARSGFRFGIQVTCILKDPARELGAYQIDGRVIALRAANAREVLVRPLQEAAESF